jgi:hypothetical protein
MRFVRRVGSLRPRGVGVVTVAVVVGLLIGLAGAAAKLTSGGEVQACVSKAGGAVRFINPRHRCAKAESSVLINQKGQPGPKGKNGKNGKIGKTGAAGAVGPIGSTGPIGPTGPTGPANTEVVDGPPITLSGSEPSGATAISTAGCDDAVNGVNTEAYGGGVNVVTHPSTQLSDEVMIQSSYPGDASTGTTLATQPALGKQADAWTGEVVINRMVPGDTATVETYVICGP